MLDANSALVLPAMTHLWSLAAEEQFYLVWPVALVLVLRARLALSAWALTAGLALMTAEQLRLFLHGASWSRLGYGIDTRSTSLLVGCLLAVLLAGGARSSVERVAKRFAPVALVYLLVFVVLDLQRGLFVGPLLVAGFCAAALVVVALDDESPISRALALRPFTFLGRISYSLYLWHVPVLAAFGVTHPQVGLVVPPAIAAAVACATASHYLVERPFLRRRQRLERRAPLTLAKLEPVSSKRRTLSARPAAAAA
jgi:peptidoglycan/LPS O-acetylase OafA/YrhL